MKVSVILPVYNVANYLDDCMESLARQTLPAYEIIAVDDGSKDGSRKVLKKWAARLPQLKVIRQKHSGAPGGPGIKGSRLPPAITFIFLIRTIILTMAFTEVHLPASASTTPISS